LVGRLLALRHSDIRHVMLTFRFPRSAYRLADTILYSASLGISRMYSHQGLSLSSPLFPLQDLSLQRRNASLPFPIHFRSDSRPPVCHPSQQAWVQLVRLCLPSSLFVPFLFSLSPSLSYRLTFIVSSSLLLFPSIAERNGPAQSTPSYPGYLLIAEAIAPLSLPGPFTTPSINPNTASSSSLRIFAHNLTDEPDLAVYEVWSTSGPAYEDAPIRVVMLNLSPEPRNVSILSNSFPSTSSSNSTTTSSITYKRLRSSEGVASTNASAATWAGQTFLNGTASGEEVIETLEGETVNVGAYEGVVVFLEGGNGSTAATSTGTGGGGASLPVVSATATTAAVKTSWGGSKMRKVSSLPLLFVLSDSCQKHAC
jgi:hypothetical protein